LAASSVTEPAPVLVSPPVDPAAATSGCATLTSNPLLSMTAPALCT
jgi:hypothetical protein